MGLVEVNRRNQNHVGTRSGWLRAAVLGVNDGLVSTAALMVGVAATDADTRTVVLSGIAAVAAGAMSMAAGEYVSVKSQVDIEKVDREIEIQQHRDDPEGELAELAGIYQERGLSAELAAEVAKQLHQQDAIHAHCRDELGHHELSAPRPIQAAVASALAFTAGGIVPFLAGIFPSENRVIAVVAITEVGLLGAGLISAKVSGSKILPPTVRVVIGGSLAMLVTFTVGRVFGSFGF